METTSDNVVAVTDRPFRLKHELMGLERSAAAGWRYLRRSPTAGSVNISRCVDRHAWFQASNCLNLLCQENDRHQSFSSLLTAAATLNPVSSKTLGSLIAFALQLCMSTLEVRGPPNITRTPSEHYQSSVEQGIESPNSQIGPCNELGSTLPLPIHSQDSTLPTTAKGIKQLRKEENKQTCGHQPLFHQQFYFHCKVLIYRPKYKLRGLCLHIS